MVVDKKEVLYRAVRSYLTDAYPDSLEEFETAFDVIYETLNSQERNIEPDSSSYDAVSLDASLIDHTVVSLACVAGYTLLKATLKDFVRRDLPKILDEIQASLSQKTGKPELVRAIRERIEGILQSL